jgi:hypothetical protein
MWKPKHRLAADRSGLRYPSDLTGAQWVIVDPMIPPAKDGSASIATGWRWCSTGALSQNRRRTREEFLELLASALRSTERNVRWK